MARGGTRFAARTRCDEQNISGNSVGSMGYHANHFRTISIYRMGRRERKMRMVRAAMLAVVMAAIPPQAFAAAQSARVDLEVLALQNSILELAAMITQPHADIPRINTQIMTLIAEETELRAGDLCRAVGCSKNPVRSVK
jgi:hypothetical protein